MLVVHVNLFCSYTGQEKKVIRYIIDDLKFSSDDFDDSDEKQIVFRKSNLYVQNIGHLSYNQEVRL